MKKMIYVLVCLTIGLVLNLAFGLGKLIEKVFMFVKAQLIESKQKGDSCLVTVSEKRAAFVTWGMSQMKDQLPLLKAAFLKTIKPFTNCVGILLQTKELGIKFKDYILNSMQQVVKRVVEFLEKTLNGAKDLASKFKNHGLELIQEVMNRVKGMFVTKKVMGLVTGLAFGLLLTHLTKFYLVETEAVMDRNKIVVSQQSNENVVEENKALVMPEILKPMSVYLMKTNSVNDVWGTLEEVVVNPTPETEKTMKDDLSDVVEETVVVDSVIKETSSSKPTIDVTNEVVSEDSVISVDIKEETDTPMIDGNTVVESGENELFIDLTNATSSTEIPVLKIQLNEGQLLSVNIEISDNEVLE